MRNLHQIHTGFECGQGAFRDSVMTGDGFHFHTVADNNALESQIIPEQPLDDPAGHGGRNGIRLNLREENMRGHYGTYTCINGSAKGGQFHLFQLLQRLIHTGQRQMGVRIRVTVTGEMFGSAHYTAIQKALNGTGSKTGNQIRVISVASNANHRIIGVGIYIHSGGKVNIRTQGAQFPTDQQTSTVCIFRISGSTQCHSAGNIHGIFL